MPADRLSPRRRLSAVLAIEITGFAERLRDSERDALDILRRRNEIIGSAVLDYEGSMAEASGHTCFASFDSAVHAVECALAAQRELSSAGLPHRMSVHLGETLVDGGQVLDQGLELARLLLPLASSGRIVMSRETFSMVRGKVGRVFQSVGPRTVDGWPEPVEVYQDEPDGPAASGTSREDSPDLRLTPPSEKPRSAGPRYDPQGSLRPAAADEGPGQNRPEQARPQENETPAEPKGPFTEVVLSVNHPDRMFMRLAGLSILERQLFTLAKAGVRKVCISVTMPRGRGAERLLTPEGLEVAWVGTGKMRAMPQPPYASVSADYLIDPATLGKILLGMHARPLSYQDPSRKGVILAGGVVQIVPHRSDVVTHFEKAEMPGDSCILLEFPADKPWSWLVRHAIKAQDSFMARNFDRKISLAVTRRLIDTWVHPNHMTVFSTLLGLAGAALLASGLPSVMIAGTLIVWLHTVLDGCDGELARLRLQTSRLGGTLDFWGDNLVHFALFSCMGWGLRAATGNRVFLLLGGVAAASSLASAFLVYLHSTRRKASGGPLFQGLEDLAEGDGRRPGAIARILARVEHILSQRDFIYLLVLLAVAGRLDLFLWAAGIGAPAFLLVLVWLQAFAGRS